MYKKLSVILALSVLTGCAGMNSDFEHGTPAKDSGYWLQQADDMTNPKLMNQGSNHGFIGASVDVKQYRLINTGGLRLPLKQVGSSFAQGMASVSADTKNGSGADGINVSLNENSLPINTMTCNAKYCYPEPDHPFRQDDKVSRVWLAPYVSPDDNVHLGEIVYFVTKKSQWAGMLENKGDK